MPKDGTSRRTFLVMLGSAVLGQFALPEIEAGTPAQPAPDPRLPSIGPLADEVTKTRRLLGVPVRHTQNENVLLWTESREGGGEPRIMVWHAETEEEQAAARRFYEVATWRSWRTMDDLRRILRDPGPWLVRCDAFGTFFFLTTTDHAKIAAPTSEDSTLLMGDASLGVRVSSGAGSADLVPRLMRKMFPQDDGRTNLYFEPVRVVDAETDFRPKLTDVS